MGQAKINESNLSKTPPCPANKVPLSFTPTSLLSSDSVKSPNWPKTPDINPITIASFKLK